jgi:hypothetical protein
LVKSAARSDAEFGYMGLGSLGDQKDAMVRVLKLFAR